MRASGLVIRQIKHKPWTAVLNSVLMALGISLVSSVWLIENQYQENLLKNIEGIDLVVGAKGSPLQIILSNVYHTDNATGNISLLEAERIEKHPFVEESIQLAYGDSYKGYRILGTTHAYPYHYSAQLKEGALWQNNFEVTLGYAVAENLHLKVGDSFYGMHGEVQGGHVHEDVPYVIVGILKPSSTILDHLIFTNIESIWGMHEEHKGHSTNSNHEEHIHINHSGHNHDEHESNRPESTNDSREITALLLKLKGDLAFVELPRIIDGATSMKSANPGIELARLNQRMNSGKDALNGLAIVILIVSAFAVFISLYSTLRLRKFDLAVLRTLGAPPIELFKLIIFEGLLHSCIGFIFGLLVSRIILITFSQQVSSAYHYDFSNLSILPMEWSLLLVSLSIGFIAALIPAIKAYNTDISNTLSQG